MPPRLRGRHRAVSGSLPATRELTRARARGGGRGSTGWRCSICSPRRDRRRPRRRRRSPASPRAIPMTRAGPRCGDAMRAAAPARRRRRCCELLAHNPAEKKMVFVHHRDTLDASGGPCCAGRGIRSRGSRAACQRAAEGCGGGRVPRAGAAAAVQRVRRRGTQPAILQHADQLRHPLESDGDRAAHRPHRPDRPDARGVRVQSGHRGDDRGRGAAHPRRKDQHVRAGGRRGRRHPRRTSRSSRTSPPWCSMPGCRTTEAGRAEAFDALGRRLRGAAAARGRQGAGRGAVRRRLRDA